MRRYLKAILDKAIAQLMTMIFNGTLRVDPIYPITESRRGSDNERTARSFGSMRFTLSYHNFLMSRFNQSPPRCRSWNIDADMMATESQDANLGSLLNFNVHNPLRTIVG